MRCVLGREALHAVPRHLLHAQPWRRGLALDPVANFHLRNGAAVLQLNWHADASPAGLSRSHGIMVGAPPRAAPALAMETGCCDCGAADPRRRHAAPAAAPQVNYAYELDRLQENNRAYLVDGVVPAAAAVHALLTPHG